MNKPKRTKERRTQAERRAETYKQLLDSACRLFGEQGYDNTSLEDIAADCKLTTRPIYHYFGNKKALFAAVNETMESRILNIADSYQKSDLAGNWRSFLTLCDDPHFRRIVLVDSPNILGRDRWANSAVTRKSQEQFNVTGTTPAQQYRQRLTGRMIMAAFAEAALVIAEAEDVGLAKEQAQLVVDQMLSPLMDKTANTPENPH